MDRAFAPPGLTPRAYPAEASDQDVATFGQRRRPSPAGCVSPLCHWR